MKATILTVGLALAFAMSATAQSTPSSTMSPQKGDQHNCIMADAATWSSLGLDDTQMSRVKEIQAACRSDYGMAKEKDAQASSVAKHQAELKEVLTKEQYEKWEKWCAERKTSSSTNTATPAEKQ